MEGEDDSIIQSDEQSSPGANKKQGSLQWDNVLKGGLQKKREEERQRRQEYIERNITDEDLRKRLDILAGISNLLNAGY